MVLVLLLVAKKIEKTSVWGDLRDCGPRLSYFKQLGVLLESRNQQRRDRKNRAKVAFRSKSVKRGDVAVPKAIRPINGAKLGQLWTALIIFSSLILRTTFINKH